MKENKIFIIAEVGVNHNGDVDLAKQMIDLAHQAGADAVKFQTFKAERLVSKFAPKAEYQLASTNKEESQFEMIKNLELADETHKELIQYCNKKNIMFLSTPFDVSSVDLLVNLGLSLIKIPSGEITNLPYLRKIGRLKKNIIISTGMTDLSEIKNALNILIDEGTALENITVLHCNTEYPTPYEDVNLLAMQTIQKECNVNVGYSDHTPGIEVAIAAVALGATTIEKHFTLDKNMEGPDHKASLSPDELIAMVKAIRNIEKALGSSEKQVTLSEFKNKAIARKSIVAACDIVKGEVFSEGNIFTKRPGTGISPMQWDEVLGQKARKNFREDELIEL